MVSQPTGAFGDNIGGMTIAGGIAAALYKRAVTSEPSVIDVSLLGTGMWAAAVLRCCCGAAAVPAEVTLDEWRDAMKGAQGQWALVQNFLEAGNDPQARDNGYIRTVVDHTGIERELVSNPVQFDETPPDITRAPQFAEHTDEILRELGIDDEELIELKIAGAVI
jgi:crotonobetainyl-CoA:carnitine CoA-transferase CaiB-like acyl-CoA transferase